MKKIIAIISACLVTILLAITVTLAVTKFTAATVVADGAFAIEVHRGGKEINTYYKTSDEYKKIMELYNSSLKENNLSSLFQGAKGFDEEVENEQISVSTITSDTESGNYILVLQYDEVQTLKLNDENYVNPNSTTNETVKYNMLYVEVANTSNYTEYTVYLVNTTVSTTYSYWQVKLIAQQADLFEYVGTVK